MRAAERADDDADEEHALIHQQAEVRCQPDFGRGARATFVIGALSGSGCAPPEVESNETPRRAILIAPATRGTAETPRRARQPRRERSPIQRDERGSSHAAIVRSLGRRQPRHGLARRDIHFHEAFRTRKSPTATGKLARRRPSRGAGRRRMREHHRVQMADASRAMPHPCTAQRFASSSRRTVRRRIREHRRREKPAADAVEAEQETETDEDTELPDERASRGARPFRRRRQDAHRRRRRRAQGAHTKNPARRMIPQVSSDARTWQAEP